MRWIQLLRGRKASSSLGRYRHLHHLPSTPPETQAAQLAFWNAEWSRVQTAVPYYAKLVRAGALPRRFGAWGEFLATMPATARAQAQGETAERTSQGRKSDHWRITGGSTAEPVQLPAWKSEYGPAQDDIWLARSWYGVGPESRLGLLWGHSHLFGTGWRGGWNRWLRETKDSLAGYLRLSAYDLSEAALRRAFERLVRFRPAYLIGYSAALDALRRANHDRCSAARALRLRVVIGAAEAFPFPDSADELREFFGAPVAMEYGSVETGLIGHTHPAGGFRIFWRHYFVEAPDGEPVRITSLYPRAFPLIRYELGDQLLLERGDAPWGVTRFQSVSGRLNDVVHLPDGTSFHSELFTHAVRDLPGVAAYQVVEQPGGVEVLLRLDARAGSQPPVDCVRERLALIHPSLGRSPVRFVAHLHQTRAGKTPMVVRQSEGGSR